MVHDFTDDEKGLEILNMTHPFCPPEETAYAHYDHDTGKVYIRQRKECAWTGLEEVTDQNEVKRMIKDFREGKYLELHHIKSGENNMTPFRWRWWRFGWTNPKVWPWGITGWKPIIWKLWWRENADVPAPQEADDANTK